MQASTNHRRKYVGKAIRYRVEGVGLRCLFGRGDVLSIMPVYVLLGDVTFQVFGSDGMGVTRYSDPDRSCNILAPRRAMVGSL